VRGKVRGGQRGGGEHIVGVDRKPASASVEATEARVREVVFVSSATAMPSSCSRLTATTMAMARSRLDVARMYRRRF
jgi:hypothetical protein